LNRFARLIASVCAAAIVLLVAFPAAASAPRCDSRGAITFAPPPTLDEPNVSIDRTPNVATLEALFEGDGYERGRAPAPDATSMGEIAPAGFAMFLADGYVGELERISIAAPNAREDAFGVERPPRR